MSSSGHMQKTWNIFQVRQRQFEQAVERHIANSVEVRSDDSHRHTEANDDDGIIVRPYISYFSR